LSNPGDCPKCGVPPSKVPCAAAHEQERRVRALRWRATGALLAASVLFVPVPFYMVFAVGMWPLAIMAVDCPTWGPDFFIVAFVVVQVVIDLGMLCLASVLVRRLLFEWLIPRDALRAVALVIAIEAAASFLPIYGFIGDPHGTGFNLWRLWRGVLSIWKWVLLR